MRRTAGFPIIGDSKYGDFAFNRECESLGCTRLFLHAYRLQWESNDWVAPLSEDWQAGVRLLSSQV